MIVNKSVKDFIGYGVKTERRSRLVSTPALY
jgi:hypothetical protein